MSKSLEHYIDRADLYKGIDDLEHYLYCDDNASEIENRPWEHVAEIEPDQVNSRGWIMSFTFVAPHPCGLTFRWSVETSGFAIDGSDQLRPPFDLLKKIAEKLLPDAQYLFACILGDACQSVYETGQKWKTTADENYEDHKGLVSLITPYTRPYVREPATT